MSAAAATFAPGLGLTRCHICTGTGARPGGRATLRYVRAIVASPGAISFRPGETEPSFFPQHRPTACLSGGRPPSRLVCFSLLWRFWSHSIPFLGIARIEWQAQVLDDLGVDAPAHQHGIRAALRAACHPPPAARAAEGEPAPPCADNADDGRAAAQNSAGGGGGAAAALAAAERRLTGQREAAAEEGEGEGEAGGRKAEEAAAEEAQPPAADPKLDAASLTQGRGTKVSRVPAQMWLR